LILAGGTFGAFVLSIIWVFLINYIRELKQEFRILDNKLKNE